MRTAIYSLRDELGVTRYIGKTCKNLRTRLRNHISNANTGRTSYRDKWIRKMLREGHEPRMDVIEFVDGDGSKEETGWIARMRAMGFKLVNGTDGGEGTVGRRMTPEAVEKLRQRATKQGEDPKQKEFMRELARKNIGRKATPEHREKIRLALTGRKLSNEQREQMSRMRKGVKRGPMSAEHREKIRQAHLTAFANGRVPSMRGKKRVNSPESRAKMSAVRTGKHPSAETRAKMSRVHKERHSENNFRK